MLCSSQHNCSQYSHCIITIQHSISIPGNGLTTKKSYLVHGWHVDVTECLCERRESSPFVRRFCMKIIYHRYTASYIACTQNLYTCLNPLTTNDNFRSRTAPLTSKRCVLYIYSTNIGTEYFKHGVHSPFLSLQNTVCFIILTYLVPVLFTFYIQGVQKLKKIRRQTFNIF